VAGGPRRPKVFTSLDKATKILAQPTRMKRDEGSPMGGRLNIVDNSPSAMPTMVGCVVDMCVIKNWIVTQAQEYKN
jgi:hypothetical protein